MERLLNTFSIDLRSLALFRVVLAIAVIANACILLPDIGVFLSDSGLYTREHALARMPNGLSLYYISGSPWFALGLLTLTIASALAMLFGWHTRVATVVTWALQLSLANRVTGLNSAADTQMVVMLFWAMFLPLGAHFSVDSALARSGSSEHRSRPTKHLSVASAALLLQVTYLYLIGALLKTGSYWLETRDAVYYAISSVQLATPFAGWLAKFPELMTGLTYYVYYLELLAVFFLFSPVCLAQSRLFVVPQLIAMHLGFGLFLSIGIFPLVSISGLLVFLPALFWDRSLRWWNSRSSRSGIALYYDGKCTFCKKVCLIFREFGLPADTIVTAAQDDPEAAQLLNTHDSWVVRAHDGRMLIKWQAVSYVWRRSPLLWPLGVISLLPLIRDLGDRLYRLIGSQRERLGRFTKRTMPFGKSPVFSLRRDTSFGLALLALVVLAWNLASLSQLSLRFPESLRPLVQTIGLAQHWTMFAPQPMHYSRWAVVEGLDPDANRHDLLLGRADTQVRTQPSHAYEAFPNFRWRKYFSRVDLDADGKTLGAFYCSKGKRLGLPVDRVSISMYEQRTAAYGKPRNSIEQKGKYEHNCGSTVHSTQYASAVESR